MATGALVHIDLSMAVAAMVGVHTHSGSVMPEGGALLALVDSSPTLLSQSTDRLSQSHLPKNVCCGNTNTEQQTKHTEYHKQINKHGAAVEG